MKDCFPSIFTISSSVGKQGINIQLIGLVFSTDACNNASVCGIGKDGNYLSVYESSAKWNLIPTIRNLILVVKIVFVLISFACLLSCASRPKATNQAATIYLITAKLGKNISSIENESKTYILYQQKPEGDHVNRHYRYVVIKKSTNEIVFEGNYQLGYVKWVTDSAIEVLSLPSVLEGDELKFKKTFSIKSETY